MCKGCAATAHRAWQRANPKNRMVTSAKQRARVKGIPFSLSTGDFEIPDVCPVLGIPLAVSTGMFSDGSPSLDRIIPELGYVPGNVVVISDRANRLKKDATVEEIKRLYVWLTKQ